MVAKFNTDDMFDQGLFPTIHSLGDNIDEVRSSIHNFNLDVSGISILAFQAGVGKSHYTRELLKSKESYLLVTGSHKLLKGEYEGLRASHWEKFSEKCDEYKSLVSRLDALGVSKRFICQIQGCDRRKCPYWKQFRSERAISPYHFLNTDRVLDNEDIFKFDTLVVDEAMDFGTEFNLDKESLNESILAMAKFENVKFLQELDWDDNLFDFLQEKIDLLNNKRYGALTEAISERNWDDVKVIAQFRPYNLLRYYYYHSIYGNSYSYYEPLLYNVFDLARQGIPVIMLDASFDQEAYEITTARYIFEHKVMPRDLFINQPLGPLTDMQTTLYESNIHDKHKKILRMDKDNYYYKTGLVNRGNLTESGGINDIKSFIKSTKRKYKNVGLITHQALEPYFNIETEHFFNLRGSNKLKDVDVLFIVGTPQKPVQAILEGYNNLCQTKFTELDIYKPVYRDKDGKRCLLHKYKDLTDNEHIFWDCNNGRGYEEKKPVSYRIKGDYESVYIDKIENQGPSGEIDLEVVYKFSEYSKNQDESEKYQAIHRARPFLNDNPIIYVFGDVPEKIKVEFDIVSYDKDNTRDHFKRSYRGVYPLVLWAAITDYFARTRSTSEEIAKGLRIYKKDKKSYNTKFITTILEGVSVRDIERIDKYLKEDISISINDIRRRYRNLKIDDRMIEDFIFYAQEGAFINL